MKSIEIAEVLDVLSNHFKMAKPEIFKSLRNHFTSPDTNTLYGVFTELRKQKLKPTDIQEYVSEYFSIPVPVMSSSSRKREVVDARHTSIYIIKHVTSTTLEDIGAMHGRTYYTVLRTKLAVNNLIDTDARFQQNLFSIGKNILERCHQ